MAAAGVTMRSVLRGLGSYLPERIVTNAELSQSLDTTDEWIRERTGICQRHVAAPHETTATLATLAAKEALERAGWDAGSVDHILVGTTTPDLTFPSTACRVQAGIGSASGAAFDLQAACSGFVYGLHLADSLIRAGNARRVLVIGAETYSRIMDWTDRRTCILFGDGAGAVALEAVPEAQAAGRGILATQIASDGRLEAMLKTTGGISTTQTAGTVHMEGKEVFRHAVAKMSESLLQTLEKAGLETGEVDWLVPHQANQRILSTMADRLGVPHEKLAVSMDRHANTSAASIPLALSTLQAKKLLKEGQLVAMPALGAGLTWGTCVIRW